MYAHARPAEPERPRSVSGQIDREAGVRGAVMVALQVPREPHHEPVGRVVVAEHRGREAPNASSRGRLGQALGEQRAEALALEGIGHHDGGLGGLGVVGEPHPPRHRGAAARLIVQHLGHEGGVVVAVHLGEVAQLGTGEVRLRGEEATVDREVGQIGEARRELGLVTGLDRTNEHPMTILE